MTELYSEGYRGNNAPEIEAVLAVFGKIDGALLSKQLMLEPTDTENGIWSFKTGKFRSSRLCDAQSALLGCISETRYGNLKRLCEENGLRAELSLNLTVRKDWFPDCGISKECLAFLCETGCALKLNVRYVDGKSDAPRRVRYVFSAKGDLIDPEDLTARLSLSPTEVKMKEDFPLPAKASGNAKNTWTLKTERLPLEKHPENCLAFLFPLCAAKEEIAKIVKKGNEAVFSFSLYTDDRSFESFVFPPELLSLAHDTGMTVDFGFYAN